MAPVEGSIVMGGVDILDESTGVSRHRVRSRVGIIPQDSWLFSGTLRSNLDVHGNCSDDKLLAALEMASLRPMVESFADGLDHEVKEKGDNFSAGEVQLICLARVLIKRPSIIFMDEATASVDLATDAHVQRTIRSAFEGSTIITIAHRLATIIDFDRVAVLDAGSVAEFGAPHALLEQRGLFAALVEATGEASAAELRERAAAATKAAALH